MSSAAIKSQLRAIPATCGIYQFFDAKNQILYIGKAKNLRKRVTSYTKEKQLSARISRMIFLAQKVEVTQTKSEVEALLLEHNLIKKFSPKFNILLRDDKTFPQILISTHKFPQITKYRGNTFSSSLKSAGFRGSQQENSRDPRTLTRPRMTDKTFGPFASTHDVNRTIDLMRKSFLLRNCSDSEFKSRQKPCLEFQIKKCSAPCVGMVSQDDYEASVKNAVDFLSGKSAEVQKKLDEKMRQFSAAENYEKAAEIRDQIKSLNAIQTKQNINVDELKDADVITLVNYHAPVIPELDFVDEQSEATKSSSGIQLDTGSTFSKSDKPTKKMFVRHDEKKILCAYISFFRGGQNFGARPYFFEVEENKNLGEFLAEFLGQFYLAQTPPSLILLNQEIGEKKLIAEFLQKISGKKTKILIPKKGAKLALIKDQGKIALQNLEQKILQNLNNKELLLEVKKIFELPKIPQRIEVYDNSHTSGTNAVGVLITAGVDGFIKSGYRKFNLGNQPPIPLNKGEVTHSFATGSLRDDFVINEKLNLRQDDTAMLREVLTRRFSKLAKKDWPDFIIIDGGKGQLRAAQKVFDELEIDIPFTCMSKGENRNAGEENFHQVGKDFLKTRPKSRCDGSSVKKSALTADFSENEMADSRAPHRSVLDIREKRSGANPPFTAIAGRDFGRVFTLPKHSPAMHYLQRLRDEAHRFAIMTHRKKRDRVI
jgi:excinuclease ABC subunit C